MNMLKKYGIVIVMLMSAAGTSVAGAATNRVAFDQTGGMLSVSGSCSLKFVLVVIRKLSDGSIWGSSNPPCANGAYGYEVEVPDADRHGGTFAVQVFDEASAGAGLPVTTTGNAAKIDGTAQAIIFAAPAAPPTAITIDTSSLAAAPDDQSFLAGMLSQFFGIITDAAAAVQNFSVIIADSVRSSLVATISLFSKTITVLPGGSITVPRGAGQMAGEAMLNTGVTDVFIQDAMVLSSSKIIVTPTTPTDVTLAVTQKIDGVGFHVGTAHPPSASVSFDWLIVQTYVAAPPALAEQSAPAALPVISSGASADKNVSPPDSSSTASGVVTSTVPAGGAAIDATTTDVAVQLDVVVSTGAATSTDAATSTGAPTSTAMPTDTTTSVATSSSGNLK